MARTRGRHRLGKSEMLHAAFGGMLACGSACAAASQPTNAQIVPIPAGRYDTSDAALVTRLPGFSSKFATVNGVRLHYVVGGSAEPLVLLPGHPETWWAHHEIMPTLARSFRVVVVDIRGMGGSDKPAHGYDKKRIAEDIYQLTRQLGFTKVDMAGHDMGAMVAFAFAFAANHPEGTANFRLVKVERSGHFFDVWAIDPYFVSGTRSDAARPQARSSASIKQASDGMFQRPSRWITLAPLIDGWIRSGRPSRPAESPRRSR